METNAARSRLLLSVVIFGTIGIFRRYLPVPSGFLAMGRGLIGALFLTLYLRLRHIRPDWTLLRANAARLLLSGAAIGFNWILLFEAYRYTSVASATLCYYMAPVFVLLASPFLLHESLTVRKLLCVAGALGGMVLVSGVLGVGDAAPRDLRGILFGLGAAALYACVILLNKTLGPVGVFERTVAQLFTAGVVLLPYVLLTESVMDISFTPLVLFLFFFVGVVHTGIAYALYFGSMRALRAQSVALVSYLDPVVAVLLSALLLHESMDLSSAMGAVLILLSAVVSELPEKTVP